MIDVLLLAIVAVVVYCVASEGPWGAAITMIAVILSGLLAMNFFEPLANYLESSISSGWSTRWDIIALVVLFAVGVLSLRLLGDYLLPTYIQVHPMFHEVGRWAFAGVAGYVTMAFLLTALHTAPLPREFIGFTPERNNLLGLAAPDRQWLGFTQYVSEKSFRRSEPRVFDGPRFKTGSFDNVWPSFPLRYASRREGMAKGGGGTTTIVRENKSSTKTKSGAKSSSKKKGDSAPPAF